MGYPQWRGAWTCMGCPTHMGYSAMEELSAKDMAALFGVETCNAQARSGGLCQNAPIYPAGRCHMHGGKNTGDCQPARFKHGRYCKDLLGQLAGAYLADKDKRNAS